jgi:Short C-terminal domain/Phospholipase_D-nuclease N-terminal
MIGAWIDWPSLRGSGVHEYAPRCTAQRLRRRGGGRSYLLRPIRTAIMILATSYPLLEVFWTMLIFFGFVVWLWILFTVLGDIFRRQDTSAWGKVFWIIFIIVLPYFGVFVYLIAEHKGMTERAMKQQEAAQAQVDQYVQSVAGQRDPAEQIAKAKRLLDTGAITQAEFDQIKQKALAAS